jgi:hypothetical protein
VKQRDIGRLEAARVKFMRGIAGYVLLDLTVNEDILEESKQNKSKIY